MNICTNCNGVWLQWSTVCQQWTRQSSPSKQVASQPVMHNTNWRPYYTFSHIHTHIYFLSNLLTYLLAQCSVVLLKNEHRKIPVEELACVTSLYQMLIENYCRYTMNIYRESNKTECRHKTHRHRQKDRQTKSIQWYSREKTYFWAVQLVLLDQYLAWLHRFWTQLSVTKQK